MTNTKSNLSGEKEELLSYLQSALKQKDIEISTMSKHFPHRTVRYYYNGVRLGTFYIQSFYKIGIRFSVESEYEEYHYDFEPMVLRWLPKYNTEFNSFATMCEDLIWKRIQKYVSYMHQMSNDYAKVEDGLRNRLIARSLKLD